jgi:hypothetical protein
MHPSDGYPAETRPFPGRNSTGPGGVELLLISWLLAAVGADGPANLKGVTAGFTDAAEEFTAIGAMPIL